MLRKIIASIVLVTSVMFVPSSISIADGPPPAIIVPYKATCNDPLFVINYLKNHFGENLVFASDVDDEDRTQVALFWNKRSRTFTLVELTVVQNENNEKRAVACILTSGKTDLDWKVLADWFA
jgi:hypothetical protein